MAALVRCGTLIGLLVCCGACDARPTAPSSLFRPAATTRPTEPPPPAAPRPPAPPLSGPSITYEFSAPLDYPVREFTRASTFVLYENGAFSFLGSYTGSYQQEDGRIIFDFGADGSQSQTGEPDANGTLEGDLLTVRYSLLMQHSDFENAVYRRLP